MMKRTAIIIVLLANILMLAHAVVPHHHHKNSLVCVDDSHCSDDAESHHHDAEEKHSHDGEHGIDFCLLKQDVVLPSKQFNKELKCQVCLVNHPGFDVFQALLFDEVQCNNLLASIEILRPPRLLSSYIAYAPQTFGLRAPPLV